VSVRNLPELGVVLNPDQIQVSDCVDDISALTAIHKPDGLACPGQGFIHFPHGFLPPGKQGFDFAVDRLKSFPTFPLPRFDELFLKVFSFRSSSSSRRARTFSPLSPNAFSIRAACKRPSVSAFFDASSPLRASMSSRADCSSSALAAFLLLKSSLSFIVASPR
jgi:hypothetical protein